MNFLRRSAAAARLRVAGTLSISVVALCLVCGCASQDDKPPSKEANPVANRVLDQVDAFNARDVDRLVANISDDFRWYTILEDSIVLEVDGKDAFRAGMTEYFANLEEVRSNITSYNVDGNRVSYREEVSFKGEDGSTMMSTALGVYEMKDGLIYRAWYFGY